jgi:hypothetical protein
MNTVFVYYICNWIDFFSGAAIRRIPAFDLTTGPGYGIIFTEENSEATIV